MSKVNVFDKQGKAAGTVDLPDVFATPIRLDLVRKAVRVARANRRQRYGASPVAGERHSTESVGKGRGMSRVPRLKQGRDAALAPNVVGGRRAHPPESRHSFALRINKKERRLAIQSALAATADPELVKARGHRIGDLATPIVVKDDFGTGQKTKDLLVALAAMGVGEDLVRAKEGIHVRAGMGKLRGRRLRKPRSLLIVTADGNVAGAKNLAGVDVVSVRDLGAELLAPGGDLGRLTVFTEGALLRLKEVYP